MLGKSANFSTTIIIQQPGWWNLAQYLQGNQLVFDCMDLHSGFEEINEDIDNVEQVIDILSDQIIVTSPKLLELKKIAFPEKTTLIRNGVNLSLFPLLEEIGVLWTTNTISPAHEHFISHLIKQKILIEIEKYQIQQL